MWINRLERKYGRYAIKELPIIMALTYAVGYFMFRMGDFYQYILFDPYLIIHNFQIWRLFTWVFCIGEFSANILFLAISVFFYYSIARILTNAWGAFRFNIYIFSGLIITLVGFFAIYGAMILGYKITGDASVADALFGWEKGTVEAFRYLAGGDMSLPSTMGNLLGRYVGTYYIYMSVLLAFAVTYPDMQVLLYFIIPIKIKWLSIIYALIVINSLYEGNWVERFVIILSLLNFIIFFLSTRNMRAFSPNEVKRKSEFRKKVKKAQIEYANLKEGGAKHKCCICGRTDVDSPELSFRYCSKCSGGKEYCSEHLFTHTHN